MSCGVLGMALWGRRSALGGHEVLLRFYMIIDFYCALPVLQLGCLLIKVPFPAAFGIANDMPSRPHPYPSSLLTLQADINQSS